MLKHILAILALIALVTAFVVPGAAADGETVGRGGNNDLGNFLVGPAGMTLYVFLKDEPGKSNCSGSCLANWPPLTVAAGQAPTAGRGVAGKLGTITRDTGALQVTYNSWPLYYWVKDVKAGDATGQGVGKVWFVMKTDTVATGTNATLGDFLVGNNGMTLYLFFKDTPGKSTCSGTCAQNWPPLTVPAGQEPTAGKGVSGKLGVIIRDDGSRQVTYNSWPLYYWVKDVKPGDSTGQGVGNNWYVANPTTVKLSSTAELGSFLVGFNGMTLYIFTKDTVGQSNCAGTCAQNWPPLLVGDGETPIAGKGVLGALGVTKRADGSRQLTYNGWPVYFWAKDTKPGETTGQGVGGVWFVTDPDRSPTDYQKMLNRQASNERLIQIIHTVAGQLSPELKQEFESIEKGYLDVVSGAKDMIKWTASK